ncbi:biotin/lipoyl-binding protein, partial [Microcoleus sp. herbarium14]|uniref:biotin/lipoyl-binding protein n=1 Tax=Microcoleus sp. herbarium14 TaxID=3055439 RepID=UPI002FD03B8E
MTNQVFSEAEKKQPLPAVQSGRDRNSAADAPESAASDQSRWQFSPEDDEREVPLEVPEMDGEQSEVWEPEETEVPASKGLRWPALLAGVGIGVAATLGAVHLVSGKSARPAATAPAVAQTPVSQTVTVAAAESVEVAQTLEATGTVAPYDLLPVLPQANGLQIKQVLVAEGDRVEKGQVMAVLDDSVLRSQIAEATAQVQSADSTVEQAQAQVQQAQSAQQEA